MRIAIISPAWFLVPPKGYGGVELVVSLETEELVRRGHDVTLFSVEGSQTSAKLVTPLGPPPDPALLGKEWYKAVWDVVIHELGSFDIARDSDVIHDHTGALVPAFTALRPKPPILTTLHGPWSSEEQKRMYGLIANILKRDDRQLNLVAISEAQRKDNENLDYAGVVYNGIDTEVYPFIEIKDDYLIFIGRSTPDKGLTRAIKIARAVNMPLKMIVKRSEANEQTYWDEVVAPQLGPDIEVFEGVTHEEKANLLAHAKVMIFPIQWQEPFGLVMTEAMACGTPVVSTHWGAAPELIVHGETGFLGNTDEELIEYTERVVAGEISPSICRAHVEAKFSVAAMVDGYERVFHQVMES